MAYPPLLKLRELLPYGSKIHVKQSTKGFFLFAGNNPAKEDSLRSLNGLVVQAGFARGNTHGYDALSSEPNSLVAKISESFFGNPFVLKANWIN